MTRSTTLYRRVLGEAFDSLPPEIRAVHELPEGGVAHGRCHIRRGRCLFARWIAAFFRFPSPGRNLPVTVRFEHRDGREVWRRDFAGHEMVSTQETAKDGGRLVERFGPCAVELAVPAGPDGLRLEPRRMWLFGVPLPRFLVAANPGERTGAARALPLRRSYRAAVAWTAGALPGLSRAGHGGWGGGACP